MTKIIQILESASDPAIVADSSMLFARDVTGLTNTFLRGDVVSLVGPTGAVDGRIAVGTNVADDETNKGAFIGGGDTGSVQIEALGGQMSIESSGGFSIQSSAGSGDIESGTTLQVAAGTELILSGPDAVSISGGATSGFTLTSPFLQFNGPASAIARPSAAAIITLADLKTALVAVGILVP